jgi:protein tyrosine phosphatase (PTP) superfamily phosphohydrolase (DUF442 family)
MDGRSRRKAARLLAAVGLALLLATSAAAYAVATATPREHTSRLSPLTEIRNFREVDPGRFYRSGQLTGAQFAEAIERLGIRTIVNLRGRPQQPAGWYEEEVETARRLGVRHADVRLSARSVPRRNELIRLLDVFRDAERPILVHCQDGADRAGEAAAIWQIDQMGRTREQALEMLTLRFLHLSWFRPAKRYFAERYLGERWAREHYDPCDFEYFDRRHCGAPARRAGTDGGRQAL